MSSVLSWISGLPGYVFVVFAFFILGIVFKAGFKTSLKSALSVGAGILAVTTVTQLTVTYMTPIGTALVANSGLSNDMVDIGVSGAFAAVVSLPFFVFLYPIGLAVNFFLVSIKWTKTLNVDFVDLFAILLPWIPLYVLTGNVILTLILSIIFYAFTLKVADWTQHYYEDYYELEGISISHPFNALDRLLAIGFNWIIDKIPGLNKIDISINDLTKKLGVFGDPSVLSFVISFALGLIAKCSVADSLAAAIAMVTVTILYPKTVGIIVTGVKPISDKMREFMQSKFKIENTHIGMDSAILQGYPDSIAVGSMFLPINALLYFVPGVRVMPTQLGIANAGLYLPLMGNKEKKGNAFRTILFLAFWYLLSLLITSQMSPYIAEFCTKSGIVIPEGGVVTCNVLSHPFAYISMLICKALGIA